MMRDHNGILIRRRASSFFGREYRRAESENNPRSSHANVPDDDEGDYSRSTDAHNVRREFGVFAIWVEEAIGYHIVDQQVYWYHHWR